MRNATLLLLTSLTLVLSGCYMSPMEMRESQPAHAFTTQLPIDQAANCLARNAESFGGFIRATVRSDPGRAEMIASVVNSGTPFAIAELEQAGSAARGKIWMSPHSWSQSQSDTQRDTILKGC